MPGAAAGGSRWEHFFELLSAAGFVVAFRLSFGDGSRWSASSRTGLRVLAATTALPAGALLGPALGAWITRPGRGRVATRALAFVLLTNAPGVAALALVGTAVRLRLPAAPPLATQATKRPGAGGSGFAPTAATRQSAIAVYAGDLRWHR